MISEEKYKEKYHENIQIYKQKLEVWVKNKMKKKNDLRREKNGD